MWIKPFFFATALAIEVTNCDCTGGAVGEFLYKLISKVEGV